MRVRRRELELNELDWWSRWARLDWTDKDAYVLKSTEFPEPFFNRAGLLGCRSAPRSLERLTMRRPPADPVTIFGSCDVARRVLFRSGYRRVDRMTVLGLSRPSFRVNHDLVVSRVAAGQAEEWSRVYLASFYGSVRSLPTVVRVVKRLVRSSGSTLLLGEIQGRAAGGLAIHRTRGFAGVYCVGTLPRYREMGVAGTLISRAHAIASSEGRRLILQTLESEAAEDFYLAGGFRRLYVKDIMGRRR